MGFDEDDNGEQGEKKKRKREDAALPPEKFENEELKGQISAEHVATEDHKKKRPRLDSVSSHSDAHDEGDGSETMPSKTELEVSQKKEAGSSGQFRDAAHAQQVIAEIMAKRASK